MASSNGPKTRARLSGKRCRMKVPAPAGDGDQVEEPLPVSAFKPPTITPLSFDVPRTQADFHEMPLATLEALGLSLTPIFFLEQAGLLTMADLLRRDEQSLIAIQGFGVAGLQKLKRALSRLRDLLLASRMFDQPERQEVAQAFSVGPSCEVEPEGFPPQRSDSRESPSLPA
jgi:hypothetical protein